MDKGQGQGQVLPVPVRREEGMEEKQLKDIRTKGRYADMIKVAARCPHQGSFVGEEDMEEQGCQQSVI